MGNSTSTSSSDDAAQKLRRELEARGVLLPPSFLLNESLSIQDRLPLQPSLFEELHAQDVSNRLLLDYMRPGLWITAQEPVHQTRVAASIPLASDDSLYNLATKPNLMSGGKSLLLLERLGEASNLQLRVGHDLLPTVSASYSLWNNRCTLFGHVTPYGQGWTGTHLEYTLNESKQSSPERNLQLSLGSYVKGALVLSQSKCPFHSAPIVADQVVGYASVKFLGTTTAVETHVPLHPHQDLRKVQTRTYFNIDLTNDDEGPPLQVSLEKTPTMHALAVSQTISFDRYQLNPLEDRAPRVRNSIAWTVRLEQPQQPSPPTAAASTTPTAPPTSNTHLAVGAAWQINRAVGVKATVDPVHGLTTAVVLRRWNQPRLACSLLLRPQTGSLVGIGLELETGRLRDAGYVAGHGFAGDNPVPETRATIS